MKHVSIDWNVLVGIAISAAVPVLALDADSMSSPTPNSEHRFDRQTTILSAEQYWFYEAVGKLKNVHVSDEYVEGAISERMQLTYFRIEKRQLENAAFRTQGYKMAIERMIAVMAPNAAPDIDENRRYVAQLAAKLSAITGLDLGSYDAWQKWFAKNSSNLRWSDAQNKMVCSE